jgi:peptidyl-prolyl cis-trans isomerase B (cyclophilin B)
MAASRRVEGQRVPSNQERRATAIAELERRLEDDAKLRRRGRLQALGALGAVIAVGAFAAGGWYLWKLHRDHQLAGTVSCGYNATVQDSGDKHPALPPARAKATGTVSVDLATDQGPVGLLLDAKRAPCAVNSFAGLAKQGYFDDTSCHRLTTQGIEVLQCGDPTGSGTGGPGYTFDNEYPTTLYGHADPELERPSQYYRRGVVAMANAGVNTNGSQFFLVYGDSPLPPNYTVFGAIDAAGLKTIDKVAKAGDDDSNGPGDGKPNLPVTIETVQVG